MADEEIDLPLLAEAAPEKVKLFEERFLDFMKTKKAKLTDQIANEKTLEDKTIKELEKAVGEFKKGFK